MGALGRRRPHRHPEPHRRRRRAPRRGGGGGRAADLARHALRPARARRSAPSRGASTRCARWSAINTPVHGRPGQLLHLRRPRHHGPAGVHALGRPGPRLLRRRRSGTACRRPTITAERGAADLGIHHVRSLTSRGVLLDVARALASTASSRATASPPTTSTPPPTSAGCRSSPATSCWCAPATPSSWPSASAPSTPPAPTSPASPRRAAGGSRPTTSPPWPPTRSRSRSTRARTRRPCSRCTSCTSWTWASPRARTSTSRSSPAACAADGRHTFLLEASPIPFTGAVGAPVNPVAIR